MSKLRRLGLVIALAVVVLGSTGAVYLLRAQRDVTTSSQEAYRYYRLGMENDLKLYDREALESYAEALKHDPNFVMATVRLAGKLYGRDRERAKSLIQSVSQLRDQVSRKEQLLLDIALVQMETKPDDAKIDALIAEFARRYPDDPESYHLRANRLMRKGKTEEVVQEFHRLIKANPNFAIAYNYLGYYAARAGDFGKAEDYLQRYRFLAPEQANPYDSLGEIYVHFGRYPEAEQSFKKALSIKADFWPSVAHLGTLEVARGNYLAAAEHYKRAADNMTRDTERFDMLMPAFYCMTLGGKAEEALAEFNRLSADVRGGSESERQAFERRSAVARVALLARAGRTEEARQKVGEVFAAYRAAAPKGDKEKLESIARDEVNLQGVIEYHEGRFAEAAEHIAKGLEGQAVTSAGFSYFPGMELRRVYLASALRQIGKHAEAEEALKPVLSRNPRFAAAAAELSKVRGEAPEAIARAGAGS